MADDNLVARASKFAAERHEGQLRKDGVTPYVVHPRGVAEILRRELGITDPEVLAAGLLHDTIEDTRTDYDDLEERFGRRVAELVALLTKDKRLPEARREDEYFEQLRRAPLEAKLCKVADTLQNLRDSGPAQRVKAVGKAERLAGIFRGVKGLERALALLGEEMAR
jgi:guanosine-3',5'-bis(diphosphate) 3'-pyrophosphohydrolase